MWRLIRLIVIGVLFTTITTPELFAKRKNPSVARYMNAVGKQSSKKHKKPIRNYTHTAPSIAARPTTLYATRKYNVITGLALKSKYEKRIKLPVLNRPKATQPHPVPGQ